MCSRASLMTLSVHTEINKMTLSLCLFGMLLTLVQSLTNMFHPTNNIWSNNAKGQIYFNESDYKPTCGWKLIMTSASPLSSVTVYGGVVDMIDNFTFLVTNDDYHEEPKDNILAVLFQGQFGLSYPAVQVDMYCVCNATSLASCQGVQFETIPRINQTMASSNSAQLITISGFYAKFLSAVSCSKKLDEVTNSCYTGSQSYVLTPVKYFVDCCALCCKSPQCFGLNFNSLTSRCDVIFSPVQSTQLAPTSGCQFWNVTL